MSYSPTIIIITTAIRYRPTTRIPAPAPAITIQPTISAPGYRWTAALAQRGHCTSSSEKCTGRLQRGQITSGMAKPTFLRALVCGVRSGYKGGVPLRSSLKAQRIFTPALTGDRRERMHCCASAQCASHSLARATPSADSGNGAYSRLKKRQTPVGACNTAGASRQIQVLPVQKDRTNG